MRDRRTPITILTFVLVLTTWSLINAAPPTTVSGSVDAATRSIRRIDLSRHINTLASDTLEGRAAGTDGGRAAGSYLVQQLRKLKLSPAGNDGDFFQEFSEQGYRNILAVIPGTDPVLKNEFILVGAHYDHVGLGTKRNSRGPLGQIHNGADDNASGTAAVLELAGAFCQLRERRPRRSLLLVFWDAEEMGLLGSKYWVSHPTQPIEHIRFSINVDMIGRLRDQRLILFGSRTGTGLRGLASRLNHELIPQTDGHPLEIHFNWDLLANSDHYPFFEQRIPILMFHTGLHPDYHRPSDDANRLNLNGLEHITRLLFRLAHQATTAHHLPEFRDSASEETEAERKQLEAPTTTSFDRLGISWDAALAKDEGIVYITDVVDDSAADDAGIKKGDRLIKFDDWTIDKPGNLPLHILSAPKTVTLLIDQRKRRGRKTVTLALPGQPLRIGIEWRTDPAEPGSIILQKVLPESAAYRGGLKVGDRIKRVYNHAPTSSEDFRKLLGRDERKITFEIERRGRLQEIRIEPLPRRR